MTILVVYLAVAVVVYVCALLLAPPGDDELSDSEDQFMCGLIAAIWPLLSPLVILYLISLPGRALRRRIRLRK